MPNFKEHSIKKNQKITSSKLVLKLEKLENIKLEFTLILSTIYTYFVTLSQNFINDT